MDNAASTQMKMDNAATVAAALQMCSRFAAAGAPLDRVQIAQLQECVKYFSQSHYLAQLKETEENNE